MNILDLPDELLVQIFSDTAACDLLPCQRLCHRIHDVIQFNTALQYAIELHAAGMVDNPSSRLVLAERLRILREKEHGWRNVDLRDKKVLPLRHNPSGIYDLTGGVLLLGERTHPEINTGTDNVHTVHLHSAFRDSNFPGAKSLWQTFDLGKQVIDVGLAIQEHDLIAIVTYSYVNEPQLLASIDIHLIKHSTGQPHPAAAKPVLHFDTIHYFPGHCSIMLEVSGDTLCFLLNNYFPFITADPAMLVIYNWKTGVPKVGQRRPYHDRPMFNSFILLSPDTVVLPLGASNCLEICHFAKELDMATPPQIVAGEPPFPHLPLLQTTCILELPSLLSGASVLRMTCRCEPNPCGPPPSATHADTSRPFLSDPNSAVMILQVHMRAPTNASRLYTMIVHRSSLLSIFKDAQQRLRMRQPTIDHDVVPPPRNLARLMSLEELESELPFEDMGDGDSSLFAQEDRENSIVVLWPEWGPAATRWFMDEISGTRWITTTCGQRLVRLREGRLHVYDFNKLALKRLLHERDMQGEPVGTRSGESVVKGRSYHPPRSGALHNALGEPPNEAEDEDIHIGWHPAFDAEPPLPGDNVDASHVASTATSTGSSNLASERKMKVVLDTVVMTDSLVWPQVMLSSLPYVETSVEIGEEYESALLDEDVIVGLKMDMAGRNIQEVVLHRIGGPVS